MKEEKKSRIVQIQQGGRITIPKDLRKKMDLREGDFVVLSLRGVEALNSKLHRLGARRQRTK